MRRLRYLSLIPFLLAIILSATTVCIALKEATAENQDLQIFIDMGGTPITEAEEESKAIVLNTTSEMIARIRCLIIGKDVIRLKEIKTVFIVADQDTLSKTEPINTYLYPGENVTFIQSWKIENHIINENIALISGVYKLRYDIIYSVEERESTLSGTPFYIDFGVNPLRSVFGVMTTASLAFTTISGIKTVYHLGRSIPVEVEDSIKNAKMAASSELRSYFEEAAASKIQSELSDRIYNYASTKWKRYECPECGTDWVKDAEICSQCGITIAQAEEKYADTLRQRVLDVGKGVVDSVDGLSLSEIAMNLGDGVTPTVDIIELFTYTGLAVIQPKISENWSKKTRNLVFTGLQWAIYTAFWIQACGISTISLVYLGIVILAGTLLPILIRKILSDRILTGAQKYWSIGSGKMPLSDTGKGTT